MADPNRRVLVHEISFSLGKKTPLSTYTGNNEDRFEMLSPMVSANAELYGQFDPNTEEGAKFIREGYAHLRDMCLVQLIEFHNVMREQFKKR